MNLKIFFLLNLVCSIAAYSVLNVYELVCASDIDCKPGFYCRKSGGKLGYCTEKSQDGSLCLTDTICKSGHCHLFKCLPRHSNINVVPKNEFCSNDYDCHFEQYCNESLCSDRKLDGARAILNALAITVQCSGVKNQIKTKNSK